MAEITTLSYKDLLVWQKSLEFANNIIDLVENLDTKRNHYRLIEQIEAASTSIPMNIAEGKGRYSTKELQHFMIIARGSLYETMTLLEIFKKRQWISPEKFNTLEKEAIEITKMINAYNKSISNRQSSTNNTQKSKNA